MPDRPVGPTRARERRRAERSARGNRRGAGANSSTGAMWRRWTIGVLIVTALVVPLIFDLLDRDSFAQAKLAMLHLFVPLAAAGPLLAVLSGRLPWRIRPRWPDLAVIAFVALAVLATIFSVAPELSLEGEHFQWQGLVSLLMYATAYAVARAALTDAPALRKFFWALALATAIVAAYGLLQQLRLDPVWGVLNKGRIFSTLGQANVLAAYFVLVLPCIGALAMMGPRLLRSLAAGSVVLGLAALGLTLSRGGYLGLLAGLAAMTAVIAPSVRTSVRFDRRRVRAGALVAVAAIVLLVAIPPARQQVVRVLDRAASIVNTRDSSIASHLDLWAVGLRIMFDHPVLGTGPDTYALVFPRYRDRVLTAERAAFMERFRPESPHNVYLAISTGLGIPALIAYLALISMALVRAVRSVLHTTGPIRIVGVALIGAIVGHLVSDAFMTAELTGAWLFWTFLGAAASLPIAGVAEEAA